MKRSFYTLIATTILASGLALATPAAAQWNGMDHSGSSYNGTNRVEEHHEMHKDHHKRHEHHAHKHHHHHKHHDEAKH